MSLHAQEGEERRQDSLRTPASSERLARWVAALLLWAVWAPLASAQGDAGPSAQGDAGPSAQSDAEPSAQGDAEPSAQSDAGASAQSDAGPSAEVASSTLDSAGGTPSEAQLSQARALFQRGVGFAEQGQFGPAAQRFREALAIHSAPAVEYNLAAALFELGQYEEAFNRAESVQRDPEAPEALRERAQKLSRALLPHTARLTVTASSTAKEDVVVHVDEERLDPAWMGVARAVRPGSHRVSAERKGERVSEREVQVPIRTSVIVDVSLIVAEQAAAPAPPDRALAAQRASVLGSERDGSVRDDHSRRRRIWLWSGIAAGIVVVGTGVALGLALRADEPQQKPVTGDFTPGVLTWK